MPDSTSAPSTTVAPTVSGGLVATSSVSTSISSTSITDETDVITDASTGDQIGADITFSESTIGGDINVLDAGVIGGALAFAADSAAGVVEAATAATDAASLAIMKAFGIAESEVRSEGEKLLRTGVTISFVLLTGWILFLLFRAFRGRN